MSKLYGILIAALVALPSHAYVRKDWEIVRRLSEPERRALALEELLFMSKIKLEHKADPQFDIFHAAIEALGISSFHINELENWDPSRTFRYCQIDPSAKNVGRFLNGLNRFEIAQLSPSILNRLYDDSSDSEKSKFRNSLSLLRFGTDTAAIQEAVVPAMLNDEKTPLDFRSKILLQALGKIEGKVSGPQYEIKPVLAQHYAGWMYYDRHGVGDSVPYIERGAGHFINHIPKSDLADLNPDVFSYLYSLASKSDQKKFRTALTKERLDSAGTQILAVQVARHHLRQSDSTVREQPTTSFRESVLRLTSVFPTVLGLRTSYWLLARSKETAEDAYRRAYLLSEYKLALDVADRHGVLPVIESRAREGFSYYADPAVVASCLKALEKVANRPRPTQNHE